MSLEDYVEDDPRVIPQCQNGLRGKQLCICKDTLVRKIIAFNSTKPFPGLCLVTVFYRLTMDKRL